MQLRQLRRIDRYSIVTFRRNTSNEMTRSTSVTITAKPFSKRVTRFGVFLLSFLTVGQSNKSYPTYLEPLDCPSTKPKAR